MLTAVVPSRSASPLITHHSFNRMAACYRVVSVSPPCVCLCTAGRRYVFGVPEGTQRLCVEHRLRLLKLGALCLTNLGHPDAFMGLPGLLLTLNDLNSRDLVVIGPSGLSDVYAMVRTFLNRSLSMNIRIHEPDIHREAVVEEVPTDGIHIQQAGAINHHEISTVQSERGEPLSHPAQDAPIDFDDVSVVPVQIGHRSMCYLSVTRDIPGKFDVDRAVALAVPRGPLYAQLKRGCDVLLEDGRLVRSEEVVALAEPGSHSLVVCEIQSHQTHLLALLFADPVIGAYLPPLSPLSSSSHKHLDVVIHFSGRATLMLREYQQWMRSFGAATHHVCLGADLAPLSSCHLAAAALNRKLSLVCSHLCPRLHTASRDDFSVEGVSTSAADSSLQFTLAPRKKLGFLRAPVEEDDLAGFTDDLALNQEYAAAANSATEERMRCLSQESVQPLLRTDSLLRFLGTGSAIPCKYRSVSGILWTHAHASFLLDCGEGSWSQMVAMVAGVASAVVELASSLRVVWISHPHADHHLGVMRVLFERKKLLLASELLCPPLLVIAPSSVIRMLDDYAALEPYFVNSYIPVQNALFDDNRKSKPKLADAVGTRDEDMQQALRVLEQCKVKSLRNCRVNHCAEAYGVAIETEQGLKLVYSGDSVRMPS